MTTTNQPSHSHDVDASQEERLAAMENVLATGIIPQMTRLAIAIKNGKLDEWADIIAEAWGDDIPSGTDDKKTYEEDPITTASRYI